MSKEDDKRQTVYKQLAMILNYKPKIEHQHIHMGNHAVEDEPVSDEAEFEEVKEGDPQTEKVPQAKKVKQNIKHDLPPADVFVNRVKAIVMEATKKNGHTIKTNSRAWQGEYVFFVDGQRIAKMMDDLRKNYEAKINEFLSVTSKYDGVMIVAPFIGKLLQVEGLRARDLQFTDFEFAFAPYYNKPVSAVKRMSDKLNSAEANILFGLLQGLLKKYPMTKST